METIHKVAAVVIKGNRLLMVRKKGRQTWTSLGGHLEPGETEQECLLREIREELGCDAEIMKKLGDFKARPVHHDANLLISFYLVRLAGAPRLSDLELEEFGFLSREDSPRLPPSITEHLLPLLRKEGLIEW